MGFNTNILTGSQSSQLFAIQQTAQALDTAQARLASGNRVNSATDNPQNYFAAFSLNSQASNLTRVLDSIGLGVQTIQAADSANNTLSNLIQTAQTTAQEAKESLTNNAEDLGAKILSDAPVIYYRLDETSGTTANNLGSGGTALNGTYAGGVSLDQGALTLSLDNNSISFDGVTGNVAISNSTLVNTSVHDERTVELTFRADNLDGRQVLFEEGGGTNAISLYLDDETLHFVARDAGDFGPFDINVEVEAGKTYQASFVLNSNENSFKGYLDGEEVGSGFVNQAISGHSGAVALGRNAGGTYFHDGANSGNGEYFQGQISDFALYNTALTQDDLRERFAITQLEQAQTFQDEVSDVLEQIDSLVDDSAFQGVNLLNNEDLTNYLNVSGTSNLVTQGEDLTSSGLGFSSFDFSSFEGLDSALVDFDQANSRVESFSNGLANDLGLIQAKQGFIDKTINTYEAGAEDLTIADLDEEGATVLALQARQEIQIETLSLSTQGSSVADFLSRNPLL